MPGIQTGRFAPSPTGELHLGNLRTALLAWLFAKKSGGRFVIRLEDLDASRVRPAFETSQLEDLRTLGLTHDFDAGDIVRQSERTHLYEDALGRLESEGFVFPCYCTRAEIRASEPPESASSAPHGLSGATPYPGTCRDLTKRERYEREASGRRPALRLNAHAAGVAGFSPFTDAVLGETGGFVDDFVLRRADGGFAYQLAVVVDDAAQGITQVVRGADLADSTPRQISLAKLLGLPTPTYAHVPLVVAENGERLAKRHGSVTLEERLILGDSPDDVLAWMAESLGITPGSGRLPESLIEGFDPEKIPDEPTVWNGRLRD